MTADAADRAVAYVACPECGDEIPIGVEVKLERDDEGDQVAVAELTTDDVWAHAWTHEDEGTVDHDVD